MVELFAGIGGFRLAFERAGADTVFASENDPHARRTYEANFRPHAPALFESGRFAGDIRGVETSSIPRFDVLTAGFPCQPFSHAGRRTGFADPRGTLFFEIARILDGTRPAAFFLENVAGLATQDGGRTLATIQHVLTNQLGYSFEARLVRACDFGLPQLRPRLFMVGFRDPWVTFQWPEPLPLAFTLGDLLGGHGTRDIARTVMASHRNRRHGAPFAWDIYEVDGREQRLTVDNVRALQGFPADFVLPNATTHAYHQLGNAVAVPAVEAVARCVLQSLRFTPGPWIGALPALKPAGEAPAPDQLHPSASGGAS